MRINIVLPSKGAEWLELVWLPGFVPGCSPESDGTGWLRHRRLIYCKPLEERQVKGAQSQSKYQL